MTEPTKAGEKAGEKMVRIRFNRSSPHKIGASQADGGGGHPSITLRQGLNHVPAAAWAQARKLPVVQHHLTAKTQWALREGKRVLVPLIEEVADKPEEKRPVDAEKKPAAVQVEKAQQGGGQQAAAGSGQHGRDRR